LNKKLVAGSSHILYNIFMTNTCLHCGAETTNPKFCGSSCAASHNNKLRKNKKCKNCGDPIPRINTYCNNRCQFEYQRKVRIQDLLDGKYVGKAIPGNTGSWAKEYLLELSNRRCSECGQGEEWNGKPLTLELDHIDGKAYNNIIENLRILCPNCHTQTDTYRAKNSKSDRVGRY
jgi:hypothetical protein